MSTPISPHLSPNAEPTDVWWAMRRLFQPWSWIRGSAIRALEERFKNEHSVGFARSFDSGRGALHAVLEAAGIQSGDGVVVQGFTCIVVPNAILAAGATPVYIDIDRSYNIDPEALRKRIAEDKKIRAVIVQHTFGVPAEIETIVQICADNEVLLIEDCAHALGAAHGTKQVGMFGDAAIFSFGRDKVVSSVSGGMATTNNPEIGRSLHRLWKNARFPSLYWVAQRLMHPILFSIGKKLYYRASLGKLVIAGGRALGVLPDVLSNQEKQGMQHAYRRLPNAQAAWALSQYNRLERFRAHRERLVTYYSSALAEFPSQVVGSDDRPAWLRYSITVTDPTTTRAAAKQNGILLGDWYSTVIGPGDCSLSGVQYEAGVCPTAEILSAHVINLPTSPTTTIEEATRVVEEIQRTATPYDIYEQ